MMKSKNAKKVDKNIYYSLVHNRRSVGIIGGAWKNPENLISKEIGINGLKNKMPKKYMKTCSTLCWLIEVGWNNQGGWVVGNGAT